MKTIKSKLLVLVLLLIGGIVMSFTLVNKEKQEVKTEAKVATLWHYVGDANPGVFSDATNWALGGGSATCGPTGDLPCEITVNATDESQLTTYLSGMSNSQILNINPNSRRD
ncbi:hypothetical protein [Olivibacter sitiensis]|uniref:hypothetical protein n=1 Tax=Olivibacter sitiensis TaxID=376470 RepID=UPI000485DE85|nr:hypothetical protein [Olivibacter sitiensis]